MEDEYFEEGSKPKVIKFKPKKKPGKLKRYWGKVQQFRQNLKEQEKKRYEKQLAKYREQAAWEKQKYKALSAAQKEKMKYERYKAKTKKYRQTLQPDYGFYAPTASTGKRKKKKWKNPFFEPLA